MEYVGEETLVEEESGDGGWVETHQLNDDGTTQLDDKICELTLDESKVWLPPLIIVRFSLLLIRFFFRMKCIRRTATNRRQA